MGKPSLITISMLYELILEVQSEIKQLKERDFNNNFKVFSMNEVSKLERKSSDTIKDEIKSGLRQFHSHKKRRVKRSDGTVELHDVYTFLGKHLEAAKPDLHEIQGSIRMESTDDIIKNIIRKHSEN